MAAESAANRYVRHLNAEMHAIAAHITKQMHYINDELYPTIHNVYLKKIKVSTNEKEQRSIAKNGHIEKQRMEETLFNGYSNLLIAINNLLQIELSSDNVEIIAPVLGTLKMKLKELDRLLKQYRDIYKPRGRLMHNQLDSRVVHPYVSPIYTSESYVHVPGSLPITSSLRNSHKSRGSVRINPIANEYAVERFGSRAATTYPSSYISKAKRNAYQELIKKYKRNNNATHHTSHAAIRRFKREMAQANTVRKKVEANQASFNKTLAKRKTLKRKYNKMSH